MRCKALARLQLLDVPLDVAEQDVLVAALGLLDQAFEALQCVRHQLFRFKLRLAALVVGSRVLADNVDANGLLVSRVLVQGWLVH